MPGKNGEMSGLLDQQNVNSLDDDLDAVPDLQVQVVNGIQRHHGGHLRRGLDVEAYLPHQGSLFYFLDCSGDLISGTVFHRLLLGEIIARRRSRGR